MLQDRFIRAAAISSVSTRPTPPDSADRQTRQHSELLVTERELQSLPVFEGNTGRALGGNDEKRIIRIQKYKSLFNIIEESQRAKCLSQISKRQKNIYTTLGLEATMSQLDPNGINITTTNS